jgi:chromosome segregation ATPase
VPISSNVEAASVPAKLLGELFVERGLITSEELDEALAAQKLNGKRLGEVLVMKGYVSGPALTTMLAEQLGVEMEKQTGYGSGLWSEIKRRHPRGGRNRDTGTSEAGPRVESEPRLALIDGLAAEVGVLQPVDGELSTTPELPDLTDEHESLRQQMTFAGTRLDEERAAHDGTQRMLEEARAEAERLSREADEWRERAAQADDVDANAKAAAELARLEEIAAELRTDIEGRDAQLAESATVRQSLEAQLEELRAGFAAREAELAGNAASKAEMKAELAAATNELDAVRAELAASEESHANELKTRGAVEAELEGLRQQITLAATRLDEERAAHDATQRMLEETRVEAQGLSREAETSGQLRDDVAARVAELAEGAKARAAIESEVARLQAALSEAREEHSAFETAAAAATEELSEVRAIFASREAEFTESANARRGMEADVAQLRAALEEARERYSAAESAMAAANTQLEELQAGFAAREAEVAGHAASKAALEADIAQLRQELATSNDARSREAEARTAVAAELKQLQGDARVLSESLEAERAEAEELRRAAPHAVELERERDELRAAVKSRDAELAASEEARSREADARVAAEAELSQLQADTRALSQSLEEAEGAHIAARREVGRLESRCTALESKLEKRRELLEVERAQFAAAADEHAQELVAAREEAGGLAELMGERQEALARESERRAVVESQLADLGVGADSLDHRYQEECAAHVETRRELERVEAELADLRPLGDRLAATESELATCAKLLEDVSEGLAEAKKRFGERDFSDADQSRHLVFMPVEGVYALAERPGPAPMEGAEEEIDGIRFRVTRIGGSPLPSDKRRCVFVEAAPGSVLEMPAAREDHRRAG